MADETSEDRRDAATGAAIGMATRRGLFGGGAGASGGIGSAIERRRRQEPSEGSMMVTIIVVCAILFGMLAIMFYFNAK